MDAKTKKKSVEKRVGRKKKELVVDSPESEVKKKKTTKKAKLATKKKSEGHDTGLAPTFEQVQIRAYFISEHRRSIGVAGDEHSDWIRAERELRDELLAEKISVQN
jgi:hypothetical protein